MHGWLVEYIENKGPHTEELRGLWMADGDAVVASAGWALTSKRVAKSPEGLDLPGLLNTIGSEMVAAAELHLALRADLDRRNRATQ